MLTLFCPLASLTTDAHSVLSIGFPHDRRSLCSVQISCSIFLRYDSSTSVHLILGRSFFIPHPGLSSNNFFPVLVPVLTTCPRHSIKPTLITVAISEYLNLLLILDPSVLSSNHFNMMVQYFPVARHQDFFNFIYQGQRFSTIVHNWS
jgi:hypothetical protein